MGGARSDELPSIKSRRVVGPIYRRTRRKTLTSSPYSDIFLFGFLLLVLIMAVNLLSWEMSLPSTPWRIDSSDRRRNLEAVVSEESNLPRTFFGGLRSVFQPQSSPDRHVEEIRRSRLGGSLAKSMPVSNTAAFVVESIRERESADSSRGLDDRISDERPGEKAEMKSSDRVFGQESETSDEASPLNNNSHVRKDSWAERWLVVRAND